MGAQQRGPGGTTGTAAEAGQGPVRGARRRSPAGRGVQRLGHRPCLRLVDRGEDARILLQHQQQPPVRRSARPALQAFGLADGRGRAAIWRRPRRPVPAPRRRAGRRDRPPADGGAARNPGVDPRRDGVQPLPAPPGVPGTARFERADTRTALVPVVGGGLLMQGTQLKALQENDSGIAGALDLIAGFDDALVHGFARLGEERASALAALAAAMAVTPLGERVGEAVEKVSAGSIADEHLMALAGARAALFGAVHDALLSRLDEATGRRRALWAAPAGAVA